MGVIFDRKLTWIPYLKTLKNDCLKRNNILKIIAANNWGADYQTLLCTYRAIIRSKLDYGCIVYNSARQSTLKTINSIQTSALRIVTGCFRTSPIQSILIETEELPLDIRRNILTIQYAFKILTSPNSKIYSYVFPNRRQNNIRTNNIPFCERVLNYMNDIDLTFPPMIPITYRSDIIPWKLQTPPIITTLAEYNKHGTNTSTFIQLFNEISGTHPNFKHIFTDASKLNEKNGCGVVFPDCTMLYSLPNFLTIYSSELFAIKFTLKRILETDHYSPCLIFSDSMSALQSLQQRSPTHSLVQELQILYNKILHANKHVIFAWIPSHIGITGNEEADVAAKEATRHPTSMPNLKVPHHDFQTYIKHTVNKQWKLQWSSTSTSKLHEVRHGPTHNQLPKDITRRDQVVLTRLRIGHTRITHSHILNHEPQPSCDQCHTNLTVRHILVECPRYDEQRRKYHVPEDMSTALSDATRSEKVLKFAKEIKLYEHI
mgnify:CR=1 FL=1